MSLLEKNLYVDSVQVPCYCYRMFNATFCVWTSDNTTKDKEAEIRVDFPTGAKEQERH